MKKPYSIHIIPRVYNVRKIINYAIPCEKWAREVLWHRSNNLMICVDWQKIIRAQVHIQTRKHVERTEAAERKNRVNSVLCAEELSTQTNTSN